MTEKRKLICATDAHATWLNQSGFRHAVAPVSALRALLRGPEMANWLAGQPPAERYILIGDGTDAWRVASHEIVASLGPARFYFTDWPGGKFRAPENFDRVAIERFIEAALPWPVDGLYSLDEIPDPPKMELWRTGFEEIGNKIRLAPTTLSVVTGFPGAGKSHLWDQIWHQIARHNRIKVAIFSAETRVKPEVQRIFRECYHGELQKHMSLDMLAEADDFTRAHFMFMQHPSERPSMTWLMEMIEVAALRHGCRAIMIDPWNKIEADYDPRAMSETVWIGWCLDRFIQMARSLNIHIQIIAHPAKPEAQSRKVPPDLYSISGSAHWNNRVDQGFVVYRKDTIADEGLPPPTDAELICTKARIRELGYPGRYGIRLNMDRGVFECVNKREQKTGWADQ